MRSIPQLAGILGFGLTSAFAVAERWSLQEFCWSTWLAALVYSWTCVAVASLNLILIAGRDKEAGERHLPLLKQVPPTAFAAGSALLAILAGILAFYAYTYLFSFYGLFLSVFAEMEPHAYFGRNGFINSDFFTPVAYLSDQFWPMLLGTMIANAGDLLHGNPWTRILLPFRSHRILRIHLLAVTMPFLSLLAWLLFRSAYQPVAIVLLAGLFYLLPAPGESSGHGEDDRSPD